MCEIILHFILLEDILMTSDCRYVVMTHQATPILLNQCLYPTSRIENITKGLYPNDFTQKMLLTKQRYQIKVRDIQQNVISLTFIFERIACLFL